MFLLHYNETFTWSRIEVSGIKDESLIFDDGEKYQRNTKVIRINFLAMRDIWTKLPADSLDFC